MPERDLLFLSDFSHVAFNSSFITPVASPHKIAPLTNSTASVFFQLLYSFMGLCKIQVAVKHLRQG